MRQVASSESHSACSSLSLSIEGVCSELVQTLWSRLARGLPSLAMLILLTLVPGIALLKLVFWLLTRERDADASADESEKDYWRIHGG